MHLLCRSGRRWIGISNALGLANRGRRELGSKCALCKVFFARVAWVRDVGGRYRCVSTCCGDRGVGTECIPTEEGCALSATSEARRQPLLLSLLNSSSIGSRLCSLSIADFPIDQSKRVFVQVNGEVEKPWSPLLGRKNAPPRCGEMGRVLQEWCYWAGPNLPSARRVCWWRGLVPDW